MFKGMIQGLSLAQMEAAKRVRLMQEQMEKEKQQKNKRKRELENMQQEKSDKIQMKNFDIGTQENARKLKSKLCLTSFSDY
jgi:hypothetical protein